MDEGAWQAAMVLFDNADPAFVDEVRQLDDADRLGTFAAKWYDDKRPEARALLLEYLDRPLNAYRHEALVKRLFKRANAAGDDRVMAAFLVAFDRSVRRSRSISTRVFSRSFRTIHQAERVADWLRNAGAENVRISELAGCLTGRVGYHVLGFWSGESRFVQDSPTMPRGSGVKTLGDRDRRRLFTLATRQYLRRRAWRYFRQIGAKASERYVSAVSEALVRYRDEDVKDGLALIDNWALTHILFRFSPVLVPDSRGHWKVADGQSLSDLEPAPYYERLWKQAPRAIFDLLVNARCRPVWQWALRRIESDLEAVRAVVSNEEWVDLIEHEDADVVNFAVSQLEQIGGLQTVDVDRWLALIESPNPAALDLICDLVARHVSADEVTLEQAIRLASCRPFPLARLGLDWLRRKSPETEADGRALLELAEAECRPLRPEIIRWARGVLSASPAFRADWVLEFLDSRHADVRAEGLAWLLDEPRAGDDVSIWQKLLESPYEDVRAALVSELERRASSLEWDGSLNPDRLRMLWASVLLNIQRGSRSKPTALRQMAQRLERRPEDAEALLPLLGLAMRSVRGPEFRAGLSAVMRVVDRRPDLEPIVRQSFPELQWA
ncbi:hypothetical protein BH23PLA1_BH23PLA1_44110 [soil metagenome]